MFGPDEFLRRACLLRRATMPGRGKYRSTRSAAPELSCRLTPAPASASSSGMRRPPPSPPPLPDVGQTADAGLDALRVDPGGKAFGSDGYTSVSAAASMPRQGPRGRGMPSQSHRTLSVRQGHDLRRVAPGLHDDELTALAAGLDRKQAARRLNLHPSAIDRLVEAGLRMSGETPSNPAKTLVELISHVI